MSSITISNLDPALKERLRVQVARHGRFLEAEVRSILQATLTQSEPMAERNLYERIRARVEPLGGVELELPPREPGRDPPVFE